MSERRDTARNVVLFARGNDWRTALLRLRCVMLGHRYRNLGLTQECVRCQWVREKPNPTADDYAASRALIAAYDREAASTHSERTA